MYPGAPADRGLIRFWESLSLVLLSRFVKSRRGKERGVVKVVRSWYV
jgi:hypothetical protein